MMQIVSGTKKVNEIDEAEEEEEGRMGDVLKEEGKIDKYVCVRIHGS